MKDEFNLKLVYYKRDFFNPTGKMHELEVKNIYTFYIEESDKKFYIPSISRISQTCHRAYFNWLHTINCIQDIIEKIPEGKQNCDCGFMFKTDEDPYWSAHEHKEDCILRKLVESITYTVEGDMAMSTLSCIGANYQYSSSSLEFHKYKEMYFMMEHMLAMLVKDKETKLASIAEAFINELWKNKLTEEQMDEVWNGWRNRGKHFMKDLGDQIEKDENGYMEWK